MNREIVNAIIKDAKIYLDGQFLSYELQLEWAGCGMNFGGHVLSIMNDEQSTDGGCKFIGEILNTVGVTEWGQLKGRYVRIIINTDFRSAYGIGNIIEDKWLIPVEFYNKLNSKIKKERELDDKVFFTEPTLSGVKTEKFSAEPDLFNMLVRYYAPHFENPEDFAYEYIEKLKEAYAATL